MIRRMPTVAFALLLAAPASAQQPGPEAPVANSRCGGVLCDLYYAGKPAPVPGQPDAPDPTHLPCRDFLCAAFGGRTADAAPPSEPQLAPAAAAEPAKPAKHKGKAHRKVAAASPAGKADPAK